MKKSIWPDWLNDEIQTMSSEEYVRRFSPSKEVKHASKISTGLRGVHGEREPQSDSGAEEVVLSTTDRDMS